MTARYCSGGIWYKPRKDGMSDTEYQIYNWMHFIWLSGDQIAEQAVHNIDVMNWVMGGPPLSAYGGGGRFTRPADSEMWDNVEVDYIYPGNRMVSFMCRQIPNTQSDNSNTIYGTKGICTILGGNSGSTITDRDGNEIWSRDFGTWQSQHGFGTSPRIFGNFVLLLNSQQAEQLDPGQTPGTSRLIAVDRSSGETVWESPLTATRTCYGVPAVFERDGVTQIIDANTGNGMFGLDAKTGKMLWNLKVFDMRVCSTPLIAGDLAIGTAGSGGGGNHLVAVRIPTQPGQEPEQVYRIDRGAPYVPTPVLRGERLYMVDDKGLASCVDVRTGESLWMERVGGRQGYGASPIVVGDKMLVISLAGEATVLRASDEYEKLGEVDLGGPVGATPAFAEGCLLLRVDDELRCLGGKSI